MFLIRWLHYLLFTKYFSCLKAENKKALLFIEWENELNTLANRITLALKKKNSFFSALFFAYKTKSWVFLATLFGYSLMETLGPLGLWFSISSFDDPSFLQKNWKEDFAAFLPILIIPIVTLFFYVHQKFQKMHLYETSAASLKITLTHLLLQKKDPIDPSYTYNLLMEDTRKAGMIWSKMILWLSPLTISLSIGLLYWLLESAAILGILVVLLSIPLTAFFDLTFSRVEKNLQGLQDSQTKILQEYCGQIFTLKFLALDYQYILRLSIMRKDIAHLREKKAKIELLSDFSYAALAILAPAIAITCYILTAEEILLSKIFATVALLFVFRYHLNSLSQALVEHGEAKIAAKRILSFINERSTNSENAPSPESTGAIFLEDYLSFSDCGETNLGKIIPGQSIGIVGESGSGKSHLLNCIAGFSAPSLGTIRSFGKVAWAGQNPWLFEGTIRDNILFYSPFDEKKYKKIISSLQLDHDLQRLHQGDQTRLYENGANLSLGQRQRIALARTLYQEADIYLFDDPFSGLDPHVGARFNEDVIHGLLKEKTRIVVTHKWEFLNKIDQLIVFNQNRASSLYRNVSSFLQSKVNATWVEKEQEQFIPTAVSQHVKKEEESPLSSESKSIKSYLNQLSFPQSSAWLLILCCLPLLFQYGGNYLLGISVDKKLETIWTASGFFFASLASAYLTFKIFKLFYSRGLKVASATYSKMLETMAELPLHFYKKITSGSILFHFSSDMVKIDENLPGQINTTRQFFLSLFFSTLTIILGMPYLVLFFIPMGLLFTYYYKRVAKATLALAQKIGEASKSESKMLHETLQGLCFISLYGKQEDYSKEKNKKFSETHAFQRLQNGIQSWLSLRLEGMGIVMTAILCIFLALMKSPFLALSSGLLLSYAFMLTQELAQCISQLILLQKDIVAWERVTSFIELKKGQALSSQDEISIEEGSILFNRVSFRHSDESTWIFEPFSLQINPGEKIGIIGRTGEGKTTLFNLLYRFLEPSSGSIQIDQYNIATLPEKTLQQSIAVMPQIPILSGFTIKQILDPHHLHPYHHLREILEDLELWEKVNHHPQAVDLPIDDSFSMGERQLLLFGQLLLKQSKILLLDEPSSHLPTKWDEKIDFLLKKWCPSSTIVIISHRYLLLQTCNRVLKIEKGKLIETEKEKSSLSDKEFHVSPV